MAAHRTQPLVLQAAIKVLREHAAGRSVDPSRLDWAIRVAIPNPQRVPHALVPARPA